MKQKETFCEFLNLGLKYYSHILNYNYNYNYNYNFQFQLHSFLRTGDKFKV